MGDVLPLAEAAGEAEQAALDAQAEKVENLARIAHEANRAFSIGNGDTLHRGWHECPVWQRSAMRAAVNLHMDKPGEDHSAWMTEAFDESWANGAPRYRLFRAIVTAMGWQHAAV